MPKKFLINTKKSVPKFFLEKVPLLRLFFIFPHLTKQKAFFIKTFQQR